MSLNNLAIDSIHQLACKYWQDQ